MEQRIAYFITPHGFGHAARAAAVMAALHRQEPMLRFEIFTKVPTWFFEDSLRRGDDGERYWNHHELLTDVGLVQKSSVSEDIPATLDRLRQFLPFDNALVNAVARQVQEAGCSLVMCDIAPLGIAVAQAAGVPSVLVENFTWDWIYQGYLDEDARLQPHIDYLQAMSDSADYLIQTEPVCLHRAADLRVLPLSRSPRTSRRKIRDQLQIRESAPIVILTMGGIAWDFSYLERLQSFAPVQFLIPGGSETIQRRSNLLLFPHQSLWFHPDLVNASDAVVGKAGYSTLSEVYHAGAAFGYVARPKFRESKIMEAFIDAHIPGMPIATNAFAAGAWLDQLPDLLAFARVERNEPNGADTAAEFVLDLLERQVG